MTNILPWISSSGVVQGVIIGAVLAFITFQILARTKVNGWSTMYGFGVPGNGMLLRAASYRLFPGPINIPAEAMYWTRSVDGTGNYLMRFPPGGLPPNDAFWSLTMSDVKNDFVENPINRYLVGVLDLSKGQQVLHVPDMTGRYYALQFTNPSDGTNFAYVGKRTTGTQAGDYFITAPGWKGPVPQGMKQISSPNNSVLVTGRVFVESDSDISTAYNLAKQIRLTALSQ